MVIMIIMVIINNNKIQTKRKTTGQTMKEAFLTQALELKKRISIGTAELDRITKNKKVTERRKRNKAILERECVSSPSSGIHRAEKIRT